MRTDDPFTVEATRYADAYEQADAADDGCDPWEYRPSSRGESCRECGEWFEVGNFAQRLCCVCENE